MGLRRGTANRLEALATPGKLASAEWPSEKRCDAGNRGMVTLERRK